MEPNLNKKTDTPSAGPAKPLALEVKNRVADLRAFTGLTKVEFESKMKSMGFAEGGDDVGMGGSAINQNRQDS